MCNPTRWLFIKSIECIHIEIYRLLWCLFHYVNITYILFWWHYFFSCFRLNYSSLNLTDKSKYLVNPFNLLNLECYILIYRKQNLWIFIKIKIFDGISWSLVKLKNSVRFEIREPGRTAVLAFTIRQLYEV